MAALTSTTPHLSTSVVPQPVLPAEVTFPERIRFTREAYHQMAESGAIDADERVELLNGELVPMSPVGPWHQSVVDQLNDFFALRLSGRFLCRGRGPQATNEISEPIPDYQLLKPSKDYYRSNHPKPKDILLVIEVSDSSLAKYLGPKMQIYAAAGIVEYWVVDLMNRKLVVHTEPDQPTAKYGNVVVHDDTMKVAPGVAADCELDLAWLFGTPAKTS